MLLFTKGAEHIFITICVLQMFIMNESDRSGASFDEFQISGSTYEPVGKVTKNGKEIRCSDYPALVEVSTICAQCNDSSLDYNEVRSSRYIYTFIHNGRSSFFHIVNTMKKNKRITHCSSTSKRKRR